MISAIGFRDRNHNQLIFNFHFSIILLILAFIAFVYWVFYYSGYDLYGEWRRWIWNVVVFEFRYDLHGSLFYIPILYAMFVFWWRGILIVWLISMTFLLPHIITSTADVASVYTNVLLLSVPVLVVSFINAEVKWRNRERKILSDRDSERQLYMSQIFRAQEDERQRIAQELHDDTTQTLLVIANRTQALINDVEDLPLQTKDSLEWIRDAILMLSEDMRRLSLDLRPSMLDNLGLVPAIRWLVESLEKEGNTSVSVQITGVYRKLPTESEVMIFRIVQEALSNIRWHSAATRAFVSVDFGADGIKIDVSDNGQGFIMPKNIGLLASSGKLGLLGMIQRARFLNGNAVITSEPGKGTVVSVDIKFNSPVPE